MPAARLWGTTKPQSESAPLSKSPETKQGPIECYTQKLRGGYHISYLAKVITISIILTVWSTVNLMHKHTPTYTCSRLATVDVVESTWMWRHILLPSSVMQEASWLYQPTVLEMSLYCLLRWVWYVATSVQRSSQIGEALQSTVVSGFDPKPHLQHTRNSGPPQTFLF